MSQAVSSDPVIIIGAGPAGLAAAQTLAKRNIAYVVLEKGPSVASALRRVDPQMRLLSPVDLSLMPDQKTEPGVPTYLPFNLLVHELERYREQHNLKVIFNCTVTSVRRETKGFSVRFLANDGAEHAIRGSHVISATGIISKPRLPENFRPEPLKIRWLHSLDTRAEHLATSRRLLVVGGGASAAEILEGWLKVRQKNDHAWLSLRSRLIAIPHWIFGIDVHYFAWLPEQLPAGLFGKRASQLTEPMTGRAVVNAIEEGLITRVPPVRRYQGETVELINRKHLEPDLIVFATGFSYAFDHLKGLVDLDSYGRPKVRNCESTRTRGLFLLGFRYGRTFASPYLRGIARDAEYVAGRIARQKRSR
jgi:cation diffusion facilitator CzcD-associated flavoprotein CzcO